MSSESEKILRASFCGAANHLTQLYMVSLKQEKIAYKRGYIQALDSVTRALQQLQQQGRTTTTVSIDSLIELLNNKKREMAASSDDATVGDEAEEHKDDSLPNNPRVQNDSTFGTQPPSQPSQFGTAMGISSSFAQNPAPQIPTPQFTFGNTPSQPPVSPFTNTAASTFTQAVSNSIPFPAVSPFQQQHGATTPNRNGSRKRQFFEYIFDSSPAPSQNSLNAPSSDYLSTLFNQPQNNTTSTTSTIGNYTENGDMDFSSYPTQWKRSRTDEPLTVQNQG